jgi:hypothetical protein
MRISVFIWVAVCVLFGIYGTIGVWGYLDAEKNAEASSHWPFVQGKVTKVWTKTHSRFKSVRLHNNSYKYNAVVHVRYHYTVNGKEYIGERLHPYPYWEIRVKYDARERNSEEIQRELFAKARGLGIVEDMSIKVYYNPKKHNYSTLLTGKLANDDSLTDSLFFIILCFVGLSLLFCVKRFEKREAITEGFHSKEQMF